MALRFSQELIGLLERDRPQPLTLRDVLKETSEQGFSLAIILLIFPFLLPMPPGLTTVLGSACLFLSVQMAFGRRMPWLPDRLLRFEFSQNVVDKLLGGIGRATKVFERITRPRFSRFARSDRTWRLNGLCITWLSLLLMTPVPLTNPIPTVGILLLAISMIEMDGLLLLLGYVVVGLNTALFGSVGYLLLRSPDMLSNWF